MPVKIITQDQIDALNKRIKTSKDLTKVFKSSFLALVDSSDGLSQNTYVSLDAEKDGFDEKFIDQIISELELIRKKTGFIMINKFLYDMGTDKNFITFVSMDRLQIIIYLSISSKSPVPMKKVELTKEELVNEPGLITK